MSRRTRGTCPRCDSSAIMHLSIGMPMGPPPSDRPGWVVDVGCVHPGFDRSCSDCGLEWIAGPGGVGMLLGSIHDLVNLAEVQTLEELGDWVSDRIELDALIDWDYDTPVVRIHDRAVALEFPLLLTDFWESVEDLEDEVAAELEE